MTGPATNTEPGPLDGVRVLDLTQVLMGPFATQLLGDLGADVIKVEPPQGDSIRGIGPMRNPGMGVGFMNVNRNKRSLVLDLKHPDGLAALLALVDTADVLVYNVRPQAMARLGLTYEALGARNPRLVYVGAFGYGQGGPYATKPAYDDLIQGAIGVPTLIARVGDGVPRYVPLAWIDRAVGFATVNAVCAALYRRSVTGRGQAVDVPMFETMVPFVLGEHIGGAAFEPKDGPMGYPRALARERTPFATRDGYVCALIYTDRQWRSFFELIGQPGRFDSDPRLANIGIRTQNIAALYAEVAEAMKLRTTVEWLQHLEQADIPAMPLHTLESLIEDPHLAAIGYFSVDEHPTEGPIRSLGIPGTWSESKPAIRRHAPRLGEHSLELLREAGFSDERIEAMLAAGATRRPPR